MVHPHACPHHAILPPVLLELCVAPCSAATEVPCGRAATAALTLARGRARPVAFSHGVSGVRIREAGGFCG